MEGKSRLQVLLGRLEERWEQEGASIIECLRPGATEAMLNEAEEILGFLLPYEVRQWFAWHDGVEELPGCYAYLPNLTLMNPLRYSIRARESMLRPPEVEGWDYGHHWVPLLSSGGGRHVVADCSGPVSSPAPVYVPDIKGDDRWDIMRVPSITRMVEMWWQLAEEGLWSYNSEAGEWHDRYDEIPEELRKTQTV